MRIQKAAASVPGRNNEQKNINNTRNISKNNLSQQSFKGIDALCLKTADLIENGGLAVSFTLQDMLGTNFPRPIMGLMRNKEENHGKKNFNFAAKEFVREFLTGPSMFIIPGVMLWGAKKLFGSAMEIPARFINNFSIIHADNAANYAKDTAKQQFYADAFKDIIKNAKGETEVSKETAQQAQDFAKRLSSGLSSGSRKEIKNTIENLSDAFVNISKSHAQDAVYTDFTIAKTKTGAAAPFKKAVSYIISYADDIVKSASKQADITPDKLKEFISKTADKKITGRFALNTAMYSCAMAFLWLIPKLYNAAEGRKNSGLKGLINEEKSGSGASKGSIKGAAGSNDSNRSNRAAGVPSFGAAGPIASQITGSGAFSKFVDIMEFDGLNLSYPLLTGVMLGGILAPRTLRAKDKYDREEILRRDLVTCAVMCLGAKELEKGFSKLNEAKSGFVLAAKDAGFKNKNIFSRIFDYLRPVKGVRVLSSDQIRAKYSNISEYMDGIKGFCSFISEQGGNLGKVFSLTEESKNLVNSLLQKEGKDIASADNKAVIDVLTKSKNSETVKKLADLFKDKNNPWVKRARTLNARFTALSTLVLVPLFLGFMLPAINERATKKRIREEQAAANFKGQGAVSNSNAADIPNKSSSLSYITASDKNNIFSDIAAYKK